MAATYPADTFQEGVDLTIEASNQLAQVVRGDANTEVTVADGSTIPSIRKAQTDSMYFKEPELWITGQTETDYLQLKKYIDPTTNKESWWFAKGAMVSSPVAMGTSPFGDDNWTLYTPEDLFISGKAEYESVYQALKGKAAEAGYNLVRGSFEEGGTLTNTNDVLWYQSNGKYYNWYNGSAKTVVAGSTPSSTGGIGAGAWVDRTDLTLRGQLSDGDGSGLIGSMSYANLRAYNGLQTTVNVWGISSVLDGAAGQFKINSSDITSADNGGTILVDAVGRRWYRVYSGNLDIRWFGAKCDGVTDDTDSIIKTILSKGENCYSVIQFPSGYTTKISGTIYVPSGIKIDLNGSVVVGSGTNNMFESGKWSAGNIISNFSDSPESSLVTDAVIENGLIQNCSSAIRVNNFIAGCRISNIRGYNVNQLLHEKRSFYCEFRNLQAWAPLDGTLLPCFHWDGAVQAMGVKRCFAGGYTIGHQIRGPGDVESFDTCASEGCVIGLYITGNPAGGGGATGITIRNWYFENNDNAIKADPAYTYENVDIDNSFFNENFVILDGPSIRSGRFGRMNKIKTSVAKPGNFNMLGNQAGANGLVIELGDVTDSTNRIAPTIDTEGRFYVGPEVQIKRVVTLTDLTGVPYARNVESRNLPTLSLTGQQFGAVPRNTVPFCETYYGEPTLLVKTQIPYQDFAMFSYNINVVDNTGSYWVRGVVMGDQVFPLSAGQKTVEVVNGSGMAQLNISVFSGVATYYGVVKLL